MNTIATGTLASLAAGGATGLGGILVYFVRRESDRTLDTSLGFAAGVMLAATSFSLLIPAIDLGGVSAAVVGIAAGTVFIMLAEKFTPHLHMVTGPQGPQLRVKKLSKIALFVLAITLHNFPEGMAVGVAFGRPDPLEAGLPIAIGIGLQNIPEGLAVAFALLREKCTPTRAFFIATLTGLVEPVGGLIGVSVVSFTQWLLPYGLAFAAGAMLFVISEEIIPETHSRGNARPATLGLIAGFLIMMTLDNVFG